MDKEDSVGNGCEYHDVSGVFDAVEGVEAFGGVTRTASPCFYKNGFIVALEAGKHGLADRVTFKNKMPSLEYHMRLN